MNSVYQTIIGDDGNCFAACLASLLEIPIDGIPNFHAMHGSGWVLPCCEWLRPMGLFAVACQLVDQPSVELFDKIGAVHIACGLSHRNTSHACIYRGKELIHDPMPRLLAAGQRGLKVIEDMTFLAPLHFNYAFRAYMRYLLA